VSDESQNVIVHEQDADNGNRYQWLNHYALFSGGYRKDALDCMIRLVQKYGKGEEERYVPIGDPSDMWV